MRHVDSLNLTGDDPDAPIELLAKNHGSPIDLSNHCDRFGYRPVSPRLYLVHHWRGSSRHIYLGDLGFHLLGCQLGDPRMATVAIAPRSKTDSAPKSRTGLIPSRCGL